jgi:hypothetical protein
MSAGTETALAPGAAWTETLELADGEELRAVGGGLGCGNRGSLVIALSGFSRCW